MLTALRSRPFFLGSSNVIIHRRIHSQVIFERRHDEPLTASNYGRDCGKQRKCGSCGSGPGSGAMTHERWQEIKGLFEAVQSRHPSERSAFLDRACAGDNALRAEIESLLAHQEKAERFLETPAANAMTSRAVEDHSLEIPSRHLGHFEIISLLGAGGMGR